MDVRVPGELLNTSWKISFLHEYYIIVLYINIY